MQDKAVADCYRTLLKYWDKFKSPTPERVQTGSRTKRDEETWPKVEQPENNVVKKKKNKKKSVQHRRTVVGSRTRKKWIVDLLWVPWKPRDDVDSHEVAPSGLAHAAPTVVSAGVTATANNHCWPLIPRMQLAFFLVHPSCSTVGIFLKKYMFVFLYYTYR